MLSVIYAECHIPAHYPECRYAECCYAECRCAECRGAYELLTNNTAMLATFNK